MHFLNENRLQKIYFLHESTYNDKNLSKYQCCCVEIILWEFNSGRLATAEQFSS